MSKDNGAPHVWMDMWEAADYLGMSARWLREQIEMERITYHRRGSKAIRFDKRDLDAYIEADRVEAAEAPSLPRRVGTTRTRKRTKVRR